MKALKDRIPQFVALSIPFFFLACDSKQAPPPMAPQKPVVVAEHPKQKTVTEFLDVTGKTQALKTIEIKAQAEGYLTEIHFQDGEAVNEGDLLFVIDPKPYEASLMEARAALASRIAEKNLAEKVYTRRHAALSDKAVSELAVEEAQAQLNLAKASVDAAQAQVDRALLDLSYTRVTAPISGRISRRMVDVGNLISSGQNPTLATLISDDPIYVYFTLSEGELLKFTEQLSNENLSEIKPKVMMGLSNNDLHPFQGVIDYIDNQVDPNTGTIQARAVFQNRDRKLLPGLYARIRVPVRELENALLTPEAALGINQAGRFLIIIDEKDKAVFKPVSIGHAVGGQRVIVEGLAPTDRVVVKGGQMLQPGMEVTVEMNTNSTGPGSEKAGGFQ